MKELVFTDEQHYQVAQEIQAEIRERNPVVFKPCPKALAVLEAEQEEMLSRLNAAGVEYRIAHEVAVPDSYFLVPTTTKPEDVKK